MEEVLLRKWDRNGGLDGEGLGEKRPREVEPRGGRLEQGLAVQLPH